MTKQYAFSGLLALLACTGCGQAVPMETAPAAVAEVSASTARPIAATEDQTITGGQTTGSENDMPADKERAGAQDTGDQVARSEAEWKKLLTPEQYHVLREKGTERPFINKYDHHFEPGTYACAACGQELFDSETKFNSGCGWPAFYAARAGDRVELSPDHSHGMARTEVTCARCGSHLGHIFDDAPQTPTGQRYCINSVAMEFRPAEGQ